MTDTKNPFFQIIKGLLYLATFVACQIFTSYVLLFLYALEKGMQDQAAGLTLSPDSLMAYAQEKLLSNLNAFLIIYTILYLLTLMILFAIRKKNFFKETQMTKFSPKFLPGLLILSVGLFFLTNSALNFLPDFLIESYREASSSLGNGTLAITMLSQAICAPLTEEITFRGLMLSRFDKAFPKWGSIAISSIFFGLIHGNPVWFVYALVIGIIFCVVAERTGSILSTLLLHGLFNGLGTLCTYYTIAISPDLLIAIFIIGLVLTILGFWLLGKQRKSPVSSEV